MRDMRQHPITMAEIEACLTGLADAISQEGRRGDMRPTLLRAAAKIVAGTAAAPAQPGLSAENECERDAHVRHT